jgi:polysaccharide biosynthesis/export protein
MLKKVILFSFFLTLACSCISNRKVIYLQNKAEPRLKNDTTQFNATYRRTEYQVQVNDNLQISIRSKEAAAARFYNLADPSGVQLGGGDFFIYLNGYRVSEAGMIDIPNIGIMKVAGLTLEEITRLVEKELKVFLTDAYVVVKLPGINFSVLGEVNRPSRYVVYQNQLTVFEALAVAGDFREIANRRRVHLVRQYPDGVKTYILDLTDRNMIASPYFFMQPNDVLYVQPLRVRSAGVGTTGFSTVQGIVTLLSIVVLVFTLTRR